MGICNSDPLGYLIKEYGEDVCKFIVADKSIDFLNDTTPKFKDRVQQQLKHTAANFDNEFQEKDKQIKENFTNTVDDIKKSNPGTLENAAKANNKSEEQMLGYDSIKAQMEKLKSQKDQKVKDQEGYLLKTIDQEKEKMQKDINDDKPSLPLYEKMPICLKQKVLSDGQEKFGSKIKEGQQKITKTFEKAVDLDNLEGTLKKACGLENAERLSKDSKSTFNKVKKALTFSANPKSCFGK